MNKDSKIYIAGHTGMVGSAIIRKLKKEGYNNLVFTPYPEYDLRNQQQVNDFFEREKPEYVFLAAAKVGGIKANNDYPAEFIYDNMMIEFNTIHAAYQNDVRKLLFLGSSCIYPKYAEQPMNEDALLTGSLEPTNEPYALAKISGLKMCDYYRRQYGCDFISAMPTNLYGPNDNYNLETSHVLPALIRKMHLAKCLENQDFEAIRKDLKTNPFSVEKNYNPNWTNKDIINLLKTFGISIDNKNNSVSSVVNSENSCNSWTVSLTLWGTGNVSREFLHVDDMADACIHIMKNVSGHQLYEDMNQTHVNIGSGKDLTIKKLAEIVKEIVGFSGSIEWDVTKPDGTPKKQLDVTLLRNLGWNPTISLNSGILSVYNEYSKL